MKVFLLFKNVEQGCQEEIVKLAKSNIKNSQNYTTIEMFLFRHLADVFEKLENGKDLVYMTNY